MTGGVLESVFGSWGAIIVQFLVTVVVVLGLIALVYWLVRRYSAGGLGRIGRGRVPRLALVDAMAVDGRRRLVLVRRDNVEHLIMIGGPADLVVEAGIQRPRRSKPAGQGDDTEIPPETTEPPRAPAGRRQPENAPIAVAASPLPKPTPAAPAALAPTPEPEPKPAPVVAAANGAAQSSGNGHYSNGANGSDRPFSFRRATPTPPPAAATITQPGLAMRGPMQPPQPIPPAAAARVMDFQGPTRVEQPVRPTPPVQTAPQPPVRNPEAPPQHEHDALPPEDALPAFLTQTIGADHDSGEAAYPENPGRGPAAMNPFARPPQRAAAPVPPPVADQETLDRVEDLEREMARLLGEITAKPS